MTEEPTTAKTITNLKQQVNEYRIFSKGLITIGYAVFIGLTLIGWWFIQILSATGGALVSEQFGLAGQGLLLGAYNTSTFLITMAILIAIVFPMAMLWKPEINKFTRDVQLATEKEIAIRKIAKKLYEEEEKKKKGYVCE